MEKAETDVLIDRLKAEEFFSLITGELIGEGSTRKVYSMRFNPKYVVKVEDAFDGSGLKQNLREWTFYGDMTPHKAVTKWLAPCVAISACGTYLIQKRASPLPDNMRKVKLPKFIADIKRSNLGIIEGKVVCTDYALINYNASIKLKKVFV